MTTTAQKYAFNVVTAMNPWPNGLGFDVTINRVRFSVYADRKIGRLAATRSFPSETAFCEICPIGSEWSESMHDVADIVWRAWKDMPELWTYNEK